MTLLKLLFITVCCHLLGAAGLTAVMSWSNPDPLIGNVVFSPFMALAGWPIALLIMLLVLLMLGVHHQRILRSRLVFVLTGMVVGAGVGCAFARGDLTFHPDPWGLAYFVGSTLAGTLSNAMILALFAAPNQTVEACADPLRRVA
jgi:hypothetical protein